MTTPTFTLSDRLRKARKSSGLGSNDMAELLETSRTTISNYESGRTEPTATTVARWADITDADLVWIIVGDRADLEIRCFRGDGDLVALHDPNQRALFTLAA